MSKRKGKPPVLPLSDPRFPGSHVVTPNIEPALDFKLPRWDEYRWRLVINDHDYAKIGRGGPWRATVTDLPSGRTFHIRGAVCDAGPHCFCAAVLVAEVGLTFQAPPHPDA